MLNLITEIFLVFSAGVGRSGTYIVIDAMLDKIKAENTVDIFNYVAYLRSRRTAMVQTEVRSHLAHNSSNYQSLKIEIRHY